MRILVTGGMGFIGTHLVRELEQRYPGGVTVVDLKNNRPVFFEAAEQEREKYDTVYHLAAATEVRADALDQINDTFESVYWATTMCRGRFIFTSSCAIHGDGILPISVYGACKLGAEGIVNAWAHRTGGRASILRLSNVVGRGCRGVIPDTLAKLRADARLLPVLGDGSARKRFTHVDDVVRVLLDPPDGIHDIAPADETTVYDVIRWCVQATKTDPRITWGERPSGWPGDMTATHGKSFPGLLTSEAAAKRGIDDCMGAVWSS